MRTGELHVGDGAAGSLETIALPASSTATHSETDGHDTPCRVAVQFPPITLPQTVGAVSTEVTVQAPAPAAGSVVTATLP